MPDQLEKQLETNMATIGPYLADRLRDLGQALVREGPSWNLRTATSYFAPPEIEEPMRVSWRPLVVPGSEWDRMERAVLQRAQVIDLFLRDSYAGRPLPVPDWVIKTSPFYHQLGRHCVQPSFASLYGPDIVRDASGRYFVLEDNLGLVGGLPDVMQLRRLTQRYLPELFKGIRVRPHDVGPYRKNLRALADSGCHSPTLVLLSKYPGLTAYYEHRRLSQLLDACLTEPRDLILKADGVYLRTNRELVRVDVIVKRILPFTEYLPGLSELAAARKVAISSFAGTGLFMDKTVFAYVPQLIRHYLDQEPLLASPQTYVLGESTHLEYALRDPAALVFKRRSGYGGHEVLVGPASTPEQLSAVLQQVKALPHEWIAQEFISYAAPVPTLQGESLEGLSDMRLFVFLGAETAVLAGGMSRVAPVAQGKVNVAAGGSVRDIWVCDVRREDDKIS